MRGHASPAALLPGPLEPVAAILRWYGSHARDLPWRRADASPWAVLVSEIMLQQTPVARVLPAYEAWLARWPTPPALAAAAPADAVRQWGRLGYPRRALRLHAAAQVISERHGGEVPSSVDALLALPGVGSYTAAAVASFAFGQRHAVLDTNVRRVLARMATGQQWPASSTTAAEIALARSLLPAWPEMAARWSVAVPWSAPPAARNARPARWPPDARGGWRAVPPVTDVAPASPTRAPTGNAGDGCWRSSGTPTTRCPRLVSTPPGRTPPSAAGRWAA
jgi:A/G-specific adenine glycosylase